MWLLGLDFGSTTSRALLAKARVQRNCVSGRMELGDVVPTYRSQPVFTPLVGESLDEAELAILLDRWLAESQVEPAQIASGGAIVTGLAARASNAAAIARLVRERLGDALIATADDPALESWLAFMGNALPLSRAEPDRSVINVDIGGGTTNLAWGQTGAVRQVGCYYLGARHVQCAPGSYRVTQLSSFATRLIHDLGLPVSPCDELSARDLERLLDFYVGMLEAIIAGNAAVLASELVRFHRQVDFHPPHDARPIIVFSGGVGELVYQLASGQTLPGTTAYGDLGIDLARRIVGSPRLSQDLQTHRPENLGRATVFGLAIHNTELSGNTVYLPCPEVLPLCDLPIIGRLTASATATGEQCGSDDALHSLLDLARSSARGACLEIQVASDRWQDVKQLGERLAAALEAVRFPSNLPLVLLVSHNIGKTLGQYATRWGGLPVNLIVLDEMPRRDAHFASLGRMVNNLVPVSFYGMHDPPSGTQRDRL